MNRILKAIGLVAILLPTFSSAQVAKKKIGAIGGGLAEVGNFKNTSSLELGAFGGIVLNHKWVLGIDGQNKLLTRNINGADWRVQFNQYGLYTEYKYRHTGTTYASLSVGTGLGWVTGGPKKKNQKMDGDKTWVIHPRLNGNTRLTRFLQIQWYVSYRFSGNPNSGLLTKNKLTGPGAGITIVAGTF